VRAAWIVALAGCDGVLGLHGVSLVDGRPDAPPPMCPAIGKVPTFTGQIGAIPARGCQSYTISSSMSTAAALCDDQIELGPTDQGLSPAPVPQLGATPAVPAIAPEGDVMVVRHQGATTSFQLDTLQLVGSQWQIVGASFSVPAIATTSSPSRAPTRRLLVSEGSEVVELESTTLGTWTMHDTYSVVSAPLALPSMVGGVALTEDGLRALFFVPSSATETGDSLYYADRATLDDQFGSASALAVPEPLESPYMTADCARIYFTALSTILYVEQ